MKRKKVAIAMLALSAIFGCTPDVQPTTPPTPDAVELRLSSTRSTAPLLRLLSSGYTMDHRGVTFNLQQSNHRTLLENLRAGTVNFFVSHHLPAMSDLWAAPIARDGLAVVVHPENPINDITPDDIRRALQGLLINWRDIGGDETQITVYMREDGAGVSLEIDRLLMGSRRITPNARIVSSPSALLDRVAEDRSAIAIIPASLLDDRVKTLTVAGIAPTIEQIGNNTYPLRLTIFIISLTEPTDAYLSFLSWVQSVSGQTAISPRYVTLPD